MKSTKLNAKSGYMLFESLIALSMVSISLYVLIPHSVQFFATLQTAGAEVAYWRIAQDQMLVIAEGGIPIGSQVSGGTQYATSWDPETAQLEVMGNDGTERVTVCAEEIQTEDP